MTTFNELKKRKEMILSTLGKDDIENLIKKLAYEYYFFILKEDKLELERTIESLNDVISIYEFEYPNIYDYINYQLVIASNRILSKVFHLDETIYSPITNFNSISLGNKNPIDIENNHALKLTQEIFMQNEFVEMNHKLMNKVSDKLKEERKNQNQGDD